MKGLTSRLEQLSSGYAQELRSIVGGQTLERLRTSRGTDFRASLTDAGVDIDRVTQLKGEQAKKVRSLHEHDRPTTPTAAFIAEPPPCGGTSNFRDVYSPPYPGYCWSYQWHRRATSRTIRC